MIKSKKVTVEEFGPMEALDVSKLLEGLRIYDLHRLYVSILKYKKTIISIKKDVNIYRIYFNDEMDAMLHPSNSSVILKPRR